MATRSTSTARKAAPIRPAHASGLYARTPEPPDDCDEFAGIERLDREELDETDADAMTPASWRHPLSRQLKRRSRR